MSQPDLPALPPDIGEADGPVFAEPWHAQIFAITVKLSEDGHFSWPQWAERFSDNLARASAAGAAKDGSRYYDVWLLTLETLLEECDLAPASEVGRLKRAWRDAYLETPHGQPVHLKR